MAVAILAFGAEADAIGQGCFESVEIGARSVEAIVGHDAGEMLANALAHDARFAVMDREAFFEKNASAAAEASIARVKGADGKNSPGSKWAGSRET